MRHENVENVNNGILVVFPFGLTGFGVIFEVIRMCVAGHLVCFLDSIYHNSTSAAHGKIGQTV